MLQGDWPIRGHVLVKWCIRPSAPSTPALSRPCTSAVPAQHMRSGLCARWRHGLGALGAPIRSGTGYAWSVLRRATPESARGSFAPMCAGSGFGVPGAIAAYGFTHRLHPGATAFRGVCLATATLPSCTIPFRAERTAGA